jgi:hypothetical protein
MYQLVASPHPLVVPQDKAGSSPYTYCHILGFGVRVGLPCTSLLAFTGLASSWPGQNLRQASLGKKRKWHLPVITIWHYYRCIYIIYIYIYYSYIPYLMHGICTCIFTCVMYIYVYLLSFNPQNNCCKETQFPPFYRWGNWTKVRWSGCGGHFCNQSTGETKAEGLWVQGQPGLPGETLFQTKLNNTKKQSRSNRFSK